MELQGNGGKRGHDAGSEDWIDDEEDAEGNPTFKPVQDYRTEREERPAQVINKHEHHHRWQLVPEIILVLIVATLIGSCANSVKRHEIAVENDKRMDASAEVMRCEVQVDGQPNVFTIYAVKPHTRYPLAYGIFGIEDTRSMMKKLDCPENVGRLAK